MSRVGQARQGASSTARKPNARKPLDWVPDAAITETVHGQL